MFVLRTAAKDLRRLARDPFGLLLWFAIPVFIGAAMRLTFGAGGDAATPQAHVLVVDEDTSGLSRLLVAALGQGAGGLIHAETVAREEGKRRIAGGEATALLVIPEGFGAAVLREEPAALRLVTNPAQRILPALVKETVSLLPDLVFYAHRLFGEPLREIARQGQEPSGAPDDAAVARIAVAINRTLRQLRSQVFPRAIEVAVERGGPAPLRRTGFAEALLPGLLFMTIFFMASGLSQDLWVEKEAGTLRRLLVSPSGPAAFLAGKLLAGACLFALVGVLGLLLGRYAFGSQVRGAAAATLWTCASGLILFLLLALLQIQARSQAGGGLLANVVMLPLLMLGGSFFPFESMPPWMAAIGRYTPNGWALSRFREIVSSPEPAAALAPSLFAAAALSTALFLLVARRLGGRFART